MILSLDYIDAKNKIDATPEIDAYLCGWHWMQDTNLDMIV
jgi:hypothetical protein